jgi:cysteinyl-tRNA synthetase
MAPTLRLYNTLTRTKEEFRPLDAANVRMYVCGPTVYDNAHIGNARPIIVFDLLFRLLRHLAAQGVWDGGKGETRVTYVRNITDVDDKINARAAERGVSIRELTEETARRFHEDIAALSVLPPTVEPRATEHIEDMKALIERLVANGNAYVAEDHVLFHVPSMPDYGSLSKRPLEELEAGARVEVAPYKRSPLDFVLWKPSKSGEPAWPSPARIATPGRPGWHIECSAMSWKHLGEVFDIHAGGIDLVFPHHENEVAQSRCCFGTDVMARYWLHNGFLQVEGEKMAKSAGNFVTIRELLEDGWDGRVIRFAMLRTHYRQPINWTREGLKQSALDLFTIARRAPDEPPRPQAVAVDNPVLDALQDDLNTPQAITELFALVSGLQGRDSDLELEREYARIWIALGVLGLSDLKGYDPNKMFARMYGLASSEKTGQIDTLIHARATARAQKNWAESDRIRDELAAMGIAVKDNKDGTTTWEVAR